MNKQKRDITNYRKQILSFVETLRNKNISHNSYSLFKGAEPTPFSNCFAIYIRHTFDDIKYMSKIEKKEFINYFQNLQDKKTGLFCDPKAKFNAVDKDHDKSHLDKQLTTFCISALECLGAKARYSFNFLNKYKNEEYLNKWLDSLNWKNPWNSGNKVMFIAICLIYNYEKFQDKKSYETINLWFKWMDKRQDSLTGFWGESKKYNYFDGMGGFYHQFVIYNYLKKNVNYKKQIIDQTLFIQQYDGGFNPELGGGSCDDLDAVDILAHLYHKTNHRRDDIKKKLAKTLKLIINNQNSDYGYCWSKRNLFDINNIFNIILKFIKYKDYRYSYLCLRGYFRGKKKKLINQRFISGWSNIHRSENKSSLFDTWLRATSIGIICSVLKNKDYSRIKFNFLKTPGLGWFDLNN